MLHEIYLAILQVEKISSRCIEVSKLSVISYYRCTKVPDSPITFDVKVERHHQIETDQESDESKAQNPFDL